MVLETIEQDNYNRKYGDKKPNKNAENFPPYACQAKNKSLTHTQHGNERQLKRGRRSYRTVTVLFAANQIGHWEHICPARRAQCNNCKKTGQFCQSVQIQDRQSDPERTNNGQLRRIMARNQPHSTHQRLQPD